MKRYPVPLLPWVLLCCLAAHAQTARPELVIQRGPVDYVHGLAFAPDGKRFATASGNDLQVWNAKTGVVELARTVSGRLEALAWSPDGSRIAGGGLTGAVFDWSGTVYLWDAHDGRVLQQWRTGEAVIAALAWSPDGQRLVTAGAGDFEGRSPRSAAQVWDKDGNLLHTLENYYASQVRLCFSSDGSRIALSFGSDGGHGTRAYDATTGNPLIPLLHQWMRGLTLTAEGAPRDDSDAVARSAEGSVVLTAQRSRESRDPGTGLTLRARGAGGRILAQMTLPEWPGPVALSPDGRQLVMTGASNFNTSPTPVLRVWQLNAQDAQWRALWQVEPYRAVPLSLAVANGVLALGLLNGKAAIWDLRAGVPCTLIGNTRYPGTLALSPAATHLAGSFLWDLREAQPRRGPQLTDYRAMTFSPDGSRLLEEGGMLEVKTGRHTEMRVPDEEGGNKLDGVHSAAFSADGTVLVTVDDTNSSGRMHLWRGDSGRFIQALVVSNPYIRFECVAFAPRGTTFAAAGRTDTLRQPETPFLGFFDGRTGRLERLMRTESDNHYFITGMQFSPDGKMLATTGLVMWPHEKPGPRDLGQDGAPVRTLRFWDVASGQQRGALPLEEDYAFPFAWLGNKTCVVADWSGVQFWSVPEARPLADLTLLDARFERDQRVIEWLVTTPDGAFDASSGAMRFLRWRVGEEIQETPPPTAPQIHGLLARVLRTVGASAAPPAR